MVERRLGSSSSEKEKENTCESTEDSPRDWGTLAALPRQVSPRAEYFHIRQSLVPTRPMEMSPAWLLEVRGAQGQGQEGQDD